VRFFEPPWYRAALTSFAGYPSLNKQSGVIGRGLRRELREKGHAGCFSLSSQSIARAMVEAAEDDFMKRKSSYGSKKRFAVAID